MTKVTIEKGDIKVTIESENDDVESLVIAVGSVLNPPPPPLQSPWYPAQPWWGTNPPSFTTFEVLPALPAPTTWGGMTTSTTVSLYGGDNGQGVVVPNCS